MSELNSEFEQEINDEPNFKKKHPIKNSIIFLLLFAVVCGGITAFLIYQEQNIIEDKEPEKIKNEVVDAENNTLDNTVSDKKEEEIVNVKKEVSECEGLKSITGTYRENNINIIDKEFIEGSKVDEWDNKININYIEIDGLKDKELQQKINKRIEEKVMSMYTEEELADDKIEKIYISAYEDANYANVLSIFIYKDTWYYDTNESKYESDGININLINGEDIAFEELFIKGAPIKNILSQAAYEACISAIPFDENDFYSSDLSKKDYSYVENEVFSIMQYYNQNSYIPYSFSYNNIIVYINGFFIQIPMIDYYEYIAIFNRYQTDEELYDGRFENNQDIMLFRYADDMEMYLEYNVGKVSENLFTCIKVNKPDEYSEIYMPVLEKYIEEINKKVEEYKNANDGKVRYINIELQPISSEWQGEMEHVINVRYSEDETSKEYYDKEFEKYIVESLCYGEGIIYYDVFGEEMKKNVQKIQDEYVELKYNFETETFEKYIEQSYSS